MNRLRVLHVTHSLPPRLSGVGVFLHQLTEAMDRDLESIVAGMDEDPSAYRGSPVRSLGGLPTGPRMLGWSCGVARQVSRILPHVDVVHIHALRTFLNWHTRRLCIKHGKPLVISCHGQLYSSVLQNRRSQKQLLARVFVDRNLKAAHRFHATCEEEFDSIRAYGLIQPVSVIPIGIDANVFDVPRPDARRYIDQAWSGLAGKRLVTMLSLIEPKKGHARLAEAWSRLVSAHPHWRLLIAGPGSAEMESAARAAFSERGVSGSVLFAGGVWGDDKAKLLAGSDVFILPSDWENFGIVIPEALACRVPAITTTGAPWSQLPERGCGWWVEPTADAIEGALREAMSLSDQERAAMGQRGREMVEQEYAWDSIARQMVQMYQQVIEDYPGSG